MINRLLEKIKRLIRPPTVNISNFQILLDMLINIKILKLRSRREFTKSTIFNLNSFKKLVNLEKTVNNCVLDSQNFNSKQELIDMSAKILRKYGIIVIKNAFTKKEVDFFLENTKQISPKRNFEVKENLESKYENENKIKIPLHHNLFLFDDRILKTIERSCNKSISKENSNNELIYIRQASKIIYFNTKKNNIKNNWTAGWHIDFPTQFATHVILDDLTENQTRMQAIPLSNKLPLIPSRHYKIDNLSLDLNKNVLNCFGPKGTLYIHGGNVLHRNFPVVNTNRYLWSQTYTLDKVFCSLNKLEKEEILNGSKEYFSSLDDYRKQKILPLINSPDSSEKNIYYKIVDGNFIRASKKEMTYL